MMKKYHELTKEGVKNFTIDVEELIFSVLDGTNKDFTASELDFEITFGNIAIKVPCLPETLEYLTADIEEIERIYNGDDEEV